MNEKSQLGFAPHVPEAELAKNLPEGALDRQKAMDAHNQQKIEKAKKAAGKRKAKQPVLEEPTESPSPISVPDLTESPAPPTLPTLTTTDEEACKNSPAYRDYISYIPPYAEEKAYKPEFDFKKEDLIKKIQAMMLSESDYYIPPMDPVEVIRDSVKSLPVKGTLIVETKSLDMEFDYLDLSVSKDSVIVVMRAQPFKARLKHMETVFVHVDGEKIKCLCMMDPHTLQALPVMVLSFFRINDFLETHSQDPAPSTSSVISELANSETSE